MLKTLLHRLDRRVAVRSRALEVAAQHTMVASGGRGGAHTYGSRERGGRLGRAEARVRCIHCLYESQIFKVMKNISGRYIGTVNATFLAHPV